MNIRDIHDRLAVADYVHDTEGETEYTTMTIELFSDVLAAIADGAHNAVALAHAALERDRDDTQIVCANPAEVSDEDIPVVPWENVLDAAEGVIREFQEARKAADLDRLPPSGTFTVDPDCSAIAVALNAISVASKTPAVVLAAICRHISGQDAVRITALAADFARIADDYGIQEGLTTRAVVHHAAETAAATICGGAQ